MATDLRGNGMTAYPSKWIGICDVCGEESPEERHSQDEAQADAEDCPCRAPFEGGE